MRHVLRHFEEVRAQSLTAEQNAAVHQWLAGATGIVEPPHPSGRERPVGRWSLNLMRDTDWPTETVWTDEQIAEIAGPFGFDVSTPEGREAAINKLNWQLADYMRFVLWAGTRR